MKQNPIWNCIDLYIFVFSLRSYAEPRVHVSEPLWVPTFQNSDDVMSQFAPYDERINNDGKSHSHLPICYFLEMEWKHKRNQTAKPYWSNKSAVKQCYFLRREKTYNNDTVKTKDENCEKPLIELKT